MTPKFDPELLPIELKPEDNPNIKRISFSEAQTYHTCAFKHKIEYILGNERKSSIHLAYGSLTHKFIEQYFQGQKLPNIEEFAARFTELLTEMGLTNDPKTVNEWSKAMVDTLNELPEACLTKLGTQQPLHIEKLIFKDLPFSNLKFKGYIDAIFTKNDKIAIIDWKSTSWGWGGEKRNNRELHYQLTLYKYFLAKQENIPLANIETYFALLKRTGLKPKIEFIPISSGNQKIKNALKWLESAVNGIYKYQVFPKNRNACKMCDWFQTPQCP